MPSRVVALLAALAALTGTGCAHFAGEAAPPVAAAPEQDDLAWEVLSVDDWSVGKVVRLRYRVSVSRMPTRSELGRVSRRIIREAPDHHGIEILFYRQGSDPAGAWTAGRATWWPNGRPGDAIRFEPGDYGAHRLALQLGDASPAAAPAPSASAEVPVELRRRVYGEVRVLEGQGMDHRRSVAQVASRHGLSEAAVEEISWEGVMRGWTP